MEFLSGSTEEKIINATFNLFKRGDISSITTKSIANEAGVNEVTLFRKFKTKDNILESTKKYYLDYFIESLNEIFDFDDEISIEEYLKVTFYEVVNFSDTELNMIKVAFQTLSIDSSVLMKISDTIILKLKDFFILQLEKGTIKEINPDILALNVYSIMFESIILWKIYDKTPNLPIDDYVNNFLDLLMHCIKKEV